MYGLVNRAVRDLIIKESGEDAWSRIRDHAGIVQDNFNAMDAYPDSITYDLVGSASELLKVPAEDILKQFGRHWILYTAAEGYGEMMDTWGDSVAEFLENLNALHARLRTAMPHLNPPSFEVVAPGPGSLTLRYWSNRASLAPMVIGILEGLGERFDTPVTAEIASLKSAGQDYDEFAVRWTSAQEAAVPVEDLRAKAA
ncbi:MAG: hypothetical protein ACI8UO_000130 [Verrucomicrobiales bacterium]|jgi:hypothetical protein